MYDIRHEQDVMVIREKIEYENDVTDHHMTRASPPQ